MTTEPHWLGEKVLLTFRRGGDFNGAFIQFLFGKDGPGRVIDIAGVGFRYESMGHYALDHELVVTTLRPITEEETVATYAEPAGGNGKVMG